MYIMRKILFFWNIEACKSILVDPKNKIVNIENEHNRSSLKGRQVATEGLKDKPTHLPQAQVLL